MHRCLFVFLLFIFWGKKESPPVWIRINQLGYLPNGIKVAVWCSKDSVSIKKFQLVDALTKKTVFTDSTKKSFGAYGPCKQTYRLNFSSFKKSGRYYLQAGETKSPEFEIGEN